jgi:hypothetical protein
MRVGKETVRYVRTNLEEPLIIATLGKLAFANSGALSDTDQAVLAAFRRSTNELHDASPEQVGEYLRNMDEDSLPGIVSNTKGILHEMQFVEIENGDGDSVYASIFDATNHPGTDVQFIDTGTGEVWEAQLKATDSAAYAQDWIDAHPGEGIFVTSELADHTGLPSSGISNHELTEDVEGTVDKLVEGDETIWDHFPVITTLTLANIIWALWKRYQAGDIDRERFKYLAARASGIKVAKIAMLSALLAIPVIGQAMGALLIAKFLLGARDAMQRDREDVPEYVPPLGLV